MIHTRDQSPQDRLRDVQTCRTTLALTYILYYLSAIWSQLQNKRKKFEMGLSTDWCIAVEYWKSSSIKVIFIDYQTSKLQYNYQSYIQVYTIEDAQSFSDIALITLSRGFSVKTLTGV